MDETLCRGWEHKSKLLPGFTQKYNWVILGTMEPQIVYQDDSYMVINKPAGIVVDKAVTNKEKTIQDWVKENFEHELAKDFEHRNGIVHRLDKDTSGVLVIAKTVKAYEELQRQFKERETGKTYIALVHGAVEEDGMIDAPVGRLPWNRQRFGVFPGGKLAKTRFRAVKRFSFANPVRQAKNESQLTLLELYPETGRTHQLRVHLKHIGHPIVCDPFYAGRKTVRNDLKWCPRLFLHAKSLEFKHPETGETVKFEAPLPPDLQNVLTLS